MLLSKNKSNNVQCHGQDCFSVHRIVPAPAPNSIDRQQCRWYAHPCTAPCARRCRPATQCDSRIGFNLPSVLHWPVQTVRQRPVHSQRQLATAVQPIAARSSTAACATIAQVCHTFSSPPASAAAYIWCASLHSTVYDGARPPRSLDLEPVSTCHPSCSGPCTRFRSNPHA